MVTYAGAELSCAGDEEARDRAESGHLVPRQAAAATSSAPMAATRCVPPRSEYIRLQPAVDRHRGRVVAADRSDPGLDALTLDDTLAFVRGFMLFSCSPISPRTGRASRPSPARLWLKRSTARAGGIAKEEAAAFLEGALIVPVLTAIRPRSGASSIIEPPQPASPS